MTSSEPASLGTLFDLISYSLDVLRSPPPPPPPTLTSTPTPTPMIDLTRACSETLESTLVLAVSQLLLHSASLAQQQQQQDSAAASSGGNPPPPPSAPSSSHSQMMDTEPLNGTGSAGSGQQSVGERQRALLELASETTELLDKAAALLTTSSSSSSSSSATKKKDDMDVDSRRKRLAEVLKARLRVWCSPATAGGGTGTTASGGGVGNGSEA